MPIAEKSHLAQLLLGSEKHANHEKLQNFSACFLLDATQQDAGVAFVSR